MKMKTGFLFCYSLLILVMTVQTVWGQETEHHHHEQRALKAQSVHHEHSVFHLDAEWLNHREQVLRLEDFQGQPLIIVMFYGNCTEVCPILIQDTWRLFSQLESSVQNHVNVLAVTFDPKNDTPSALSDYADYQQLNRENWHFLTADPPAIRELSMLLGVQFRERSDGMFEHSNLITVLDSEGKIVRRIEGLGQPVEEAAGLIENLAEKGSGL